MNRRSVIDEIDGNYYLTDFVGVAWWHDRRLETKISWVRLPFGTWLYMTLCKFFSATVPVTKQYYFGLAVKLGRLRKITKKVLSTIYST